MQRSALQQQQPPPAFHVDFIPFEFDPPGTYPPEGTDWTQYCRGYGPQKARFLLEDKLPRAFAHGAELGINFQMSRKIVGTEAVNSALLAAQAHEQGLPFALQMLSQHFELLKDPNTESLVSKPISDIPTSTHLVEIHRNVEVSGRTPL
jgi:hypothetical protein